MFDKTSFILGLQKGKSMGGGGGSGNAVVWFVTFIGADGSELFKMPVLNKDDCKDPVTHGDIETPTKESTDAEVFTNSGWSATDGGEADPTILQNITADKTVYAAFTASPRYYTIRFFDGETLHETKQFAYGTMPTIDNPTKVGYLFAEWQPALSAVTGDTDYYAQWKLPPAFATSSWEEIISLAESGNASAFSIGDERTETLTYADGTTEQIQLVVASNTSENAYAYFDENSTKKFTTLTIVAKNALSTQRQIVSASSKHYTDATYGVLNKYLNNEFYNALPESLRMGIKNVQLGLVVATMTDKAKCWIPTANNFGISTEKDSSYTHVRKHFELFTTDESRVRTLGMNGEATDYWVRTSEYDVTNRVCHYRIKADGTLGEATSTYNNTVYLGVVPAFAI